MIYWTGPRVLHKCLREYGLACQIFDSRAKELSLSGFEDSLINSIKSQPSLILAFTDIQFSFRCLVCYSALCHGKLDHNPSRSA